MKRITPERFAKRARSAKRTKNATTVKATTVKATAEKATAEKTTVVKTPAKEAPKTKTETKPAVKQEKPSSKTLKKK